MKKINFPKSPVPIVNLSKGFTLIELLVVIAIVALLASIIFASLNSAKVKGADAAIKSQLAGMRAQAGLIYDKNVPNSYGTVGLYTIGSGYSCATTAGSMMATDTTFCNGLISAATTSGSSLILNVPTGAATWVAGVSLKQVAGQWQCVDSAGSSRTESSGSPSTSIISSTITCP